MHLLFIVHYLRTRGSSSTSGLKLNERGKDSGSTPRIHSHHDLPSPSPTGHPHHPQHRKTHR